MKTLLIACLPLLAILACGPEPSTEPASEPTAAPPPVTAPEFACWEWHLLDSGTTASFRGLSAVSEDVAWVSGTGGTWGRTEDGGATWRWDTVPGAGELDFRDVDAFDATTAYLMSAGSGDVSRIYKTTDGGDTWGLQIINPWPEGFFDGMAFWDAERGILYGDPVGDRFLVMVTAEGGDTWNRVPAAGMPESLDDEAGFAASGSGVSVLPGGYAWIGSGGPEARVFRSTDYGESWTVAGAPLASGLGSAGVFSLAFHDPLHGVAVGGDYNQPETAAGNAARTADGGLTWTPVETSPPAGYRSAVAYVPGSSGRVLITVGTSGSDLSLDGGETWEPMGTDALNSVSFGDAPCAGWAAGPDGRIARLMTSSVKRASGATPP